MQQGADGSGEDGWHCRGVFECEIGGDLGAEPLGRDNMCRKGTIAQEHDSISHTEVLDFGADTTNKTTGFNAEATLWIRDNRQPYQDILFSLISVFE